MWTSINHGIIPVCYYTFSSQSISCSTTQTASAWRGKIPAYSIWYPNQISESHSLTNQLCRKSNPTYPSNLVTSDILHYHLDSSVVILVGGSPRSFVSAAAENPVQYTPRPDFTLFCQNHHCKRDSVTTPFSPGRSYVADYDSSDGKFLGLEPCCDFESFLQFLRQRPDPQIFEKSGPVRGDSTLFYAVTFV
jgi:hypothetical protein